MSEVTVSLSKESRCIIVVLQQYFRCVVKAKCIKYTIKQTEKYMTYFLVFLIRELGSNSDPD